MDVFINANNCLGKYKKKKVPFNCVLGRFFTSNKHTDEKHVPSKAGLKCQDRVRGRNKAVCSKKNSYLIVHFILQSTVSLIRSRLTLFSSCTDEYFCSSV